MSVRVAAGAAALGLAWMAAGQASAANPATPLRERLGLNPAAAIWTAAGPAEVCTPGLVLHVGSGPAAARHGAFRSSRELVAEILAPAGLAGAVARTTQACAEAAAGAGDGFEASLMACLRRADAARYLGAVTLWVESDCDL